MTEAFEKLPRGLQHLHIVSLILVAIAAILMMTPAAYHRIVEHGEDTPEFCHFASELLLTSMVPLALGMCADFYIILMKVTGSQVGSLISAVAMLLCFAGLWFVYPFIRSYTRPHASQAA
jgi:hypothetical protein